MRTIFNIFFIFAIFTLGFLFGITRANQAKADADPANGSDIKGIRLAVEAIATNTKNVNDHLKEIEKCKK